MIISSKKNRHSPLFLCFYVFMFLSVSLFLVFYIFSFLSVSVAFAVDNGQVQQQTDGNVLDIIKGGYTDIGEKVYGSDAESPKGTEASVALLTGKILSYFFMAAALIFLVLVAVSGFEWMAAAGNEEQVKKAQKLLTRAIVGFIVSFLGFIAVKTLVPAIFKAIGL